MSAFFKGLWDRVILNYKPTLVGLGFGIGILVADATVDALKELPAGWAKVAATVVMAIGAWMRSSNKALPPATPPAP